MAFTLANINYLSISVINLLRNYNPVSSLTISEGGEIVHMKKYGFIKVFRSKNKNGRGRYWATNLLTMDYRDRQILRALCWSIENYHRALKELCCVEDCKVRKEIGQRNHIQCSMRAFIRLEIISKKNQITIYQAKWGIQKVAIMNYIQDQRSAR